MSDAARNWQQDLTRAVQLHQAGRLGEAMGLYRDVLSVRPDHADALHLMGVALEQAGRPEQARQFVDLAIRLEPRLAAYRNSLGNIHKALKDHAAAQAAFEAALELDPRSAEALNNLGLLAQARKEWQVAAAHFRAALEADSRLVLARFNLSVCEWFSGDQDQAVEVLGAIAVSDPAYVPQLIALAKRSLAMQDLTAAAKLLARLEDCAVPPAERATLAATQALAAEDREAAERHYRAALELQPTHLEALRQLGKLLLERQAYADAVPVLERALAAQPDETAVLASLGLALSRSGAHERAIPVLQKMVARKPDAPGPWADLAESLSHLNRLDEACEAVRRVIALDPDLASNYGNLAGYEARRGNLAEAEWACNEALKRDPQSHLGVGNLANLRSVQGRFDEAEALFLKLLEQRPDDPVAHSNYSYMLLRLRRYAEGWAHFGWRWKSKNWTTPTTGGRNLPAWDRASLPQGRLLVWREQGIGDEILYSSMLPELVARGLDVVLTTERRLAPLFARSFPSIQVLASDDDFDPSALQLTCQMPLGDIAGLCRPDAESFSRHPARYLKADPAKVAEFRARYRKGKDLAIGFSWNSRNPNTGRNKSISVEEMAPLLQESGAFCVSLQYGPAAEEIAVLQDRAGLTVYRDPAVDPLTDIDSQAAQIAALDLVVTVSTASAHIAAALGVPTLILLPEDWGQLWYWGHAGDRTPWYPQVRLCRGEPGGRAADIVQRAMPMLRQMLDGITGK